MRWLWSFRQSLLNLASNANKFTENDTVTIAAQPQRLDDRDWITIAVTDTGIGMTEEQIGRLFMLLWLITQRVSSAAGRMPRSAGASDRSP